MKQGRRHDENQSEQARFAGDSGHQAAVELEAHFYDNTDQYFPAGDKDQKHTDWLTSENPLTSKVRPHSFRSFKCFDTSVPRNHSRGSSDSGSVMHSTPLGLSEGSHSQKDGRSTDGSEWRYPDHSEDLSRRLQPRYV